MHMDQHMASIKGLLNIAIIDVIIIIAYDGKTE